MATDIASQVVLDPLISERVTVIRRPEIVDDYGRSSVVNPVATPNVCGVLTMYEDTELIRQEFPEIQFATRVISFISKFKVLNASKIGDQSYQPDHIVWRGDTYLVRKVSPYPQFGAGFYESVASSIDRVDEAI